MMEDLKEHDGGGSKGLSGCKKIIILPAFDEEEGGRRGERGMGGKVKGLRKEKMRSSEGKDWSRLRTGVKWRWL